jgi:hypothetical protein
VSIVTLDTLTGRWAGMSGWCVNWPSGRGAGGLTLTSEGGRKPSKDAVTRHHGSMREIN